MWTMWMKRHPDFTPKRKIDLEMCGFYNNLFVADIQFFRSPEVMKFLRFIDKQGWYPISQLMIGMRNSN
jgi:hypothetical protein